jgi:hypothetical protein
MLWLPGEMQVAKSELRKERRGVDRVPDLNVRTIGRQVEVFHASSASGQMPWFRRRPPTESAAYPGESHPCRAS